MTDTFDWSFPVKKDPKMSFWPNEKKDYKIVQIKGGPYNQNPFNGYNIYKNIVTLLYIKELKLCRNVTYMLATPYFKHTKLFLG